MLKRLKKMIDSSQSSSPVVAEPQVDIGGGVLVGSHHLTYLNSRCTGQPTKFARALLRVLFTGDELKGRSLFGVACNAHKDKAVKEALDSTRVNALISYTVSSFGLLDDTKVKNSLSSLLVREGK
ncbi:uncharacterized protein LOC135383472 [Ornithodoros turicata]|uniref:uncharacterized protein LOC135383472 n=1 Tax=Ornithodoros turicata TaxID=34597 RepID=UPI0031398BCB